MPKLSFPGLGAFLPPADHEAANTATKSNELSRIGLALGQAAEHTDPSAQRGAVESAKRQRDILAIHLNAADDAIASVEAQIEPPAKAPARGPGK